MNEDNGLVDDPVDENLDTQDEYDAEITLPHKQRFRSQMDV